MLSASKSIIALGVVAVLAFAGWSAWWWVAATAQQAAVSGWLEDRRADGWAAEAEETSMSGYPNRLDLTLTGLTLADPKAGWAWSAPALRSHQLSYRPHEAIVVFPHAQTLSIPGATLTAGRAETLREEYAIRRRGWACAGRFWKGPRSICRWPVRRPRPGPHLPPPRWSRCARPRPRRPKTAPMPMTWR